MVLHGGRVFALSYVTLLNRFFNRLRMPGHMHRECLALRRHLFIPWCP